MRSNKHHYVVLGLINFVTVVVYLLIMIGWITISISIVDIMLKTTSSSSLDHERDNYSVAIP